MAQDRRAGLLPFAIAAVAGSTNTGSVDDMAGLADLAQAEDLWLHIDAAYGRAALLSRRDAGRMALDCGSVTIDPHKWFFQPFDIGALLVRRGSDLRTTFDREAEYYRTPGARRPRALPALDGGTRRFRPEALDELEAPRDARARQARGADGRSRGTTRRARRGERHSSDPPEPELSVVCFRWLPGGARPPPPTATLDEVQDRLQRALEVSGEGWVSTTRLRGATWLRAGIVNYLSTEEHADRMLAILRRLGTGVAEEVGL
jgi:glutamate/tyrosine decarboxylase-like PLP-dependent enzyme